MFKCMHFIEHIFQKWEWVIQEAMKARVCQTKKFIVHQPFTIRQFSIPSDDWSYCFFIITTENRIGLFLCVQEIGICKVCNKLFSLAMVSHKYVSFVLTNFNLPNTSKNFAFKFAMLCFLFFLLRYK